MHCHTEPVMLVLTVTVIVSAQTSNDVIKTKFEKALSQLGKDDEKVS